MPAGRTETDVANAALDLLGETRTILSLNDNTPRARLLKRHFPRSRDEALAGYAWNEALKLATLNPTPGVETASWDHAYLIPGDYIHWQPWIETDDEFYEGEIVGRYVLASPCQDPDSPDNTPILFRYVFRLEAVGLWSVGLESAVAAKLAFYCARGITGSSADRQAMANLFMSALADAKSADAKANAKRATFATTARYRSNWLGARVNRRVR